MLQNDTNFVNTVITANDIWWYHFDSITKSEISVLKHIDSQPLKKIYRTKPVGMVMVIIFFDHKSVIYQHGVFHQKLQ